MPVREGRAARLRNPHRGRGVFVVVSQTAEYPPAMHSL